LTFVAASCGAALAPGVTASLLGRHLPYDELALSNLLTDVLELLLMPFLLA